MSPTKPKLIVEQRIVKCSTCFEIKVFCIILSRILNFAKTFFLNNTIFHILIWQPCTIWQRCLRRCKILNIVWGQALLLYRLQQFFQQKCLPFLNLPKRSTTRTRLPMPSRREPMSGPSFLELLSLFCQRYLSHHLSFKYCACHRFCCDELVDDCGTTKPLSEQHVSMTAGKLKAR